MGRDEISGRAVNLLPGELPSDVYMEVGMISCRKVMDLADAGDATGKLILSKVTELNKWRNLVKQNVMTSVYGVTRTGAREQLVPRLLELGMERKDVAKAASWLAKVTMESIGDAQVKALSTKITHHVDAEFADEVEEAPGRVRVTLTNGQVLEQKVWYASGSPQNQMTPAQIEARFMDCALLTKKEADARRLFAFVSDLPNRSSFEGFWPLLGAG
jgi:hypothetical protein